MRPLLTLVGLVFLMTGCTPRRGSWRHGPLDLSPAPTAVRLPHPLNPGRVRAELCLGLGSAISGATQLAIKPFRPDSSVQLVGAGGDTVHVRAILRTAEGDAWAYRALLRHGPPDSLNALCFGNPSTAGAPSITYLELSASRAIRVDYLTWQAWAWPPFFIL